MRRCWESRRLCVATVIYDFACGGDSSAPGDSGFLGVCSEAIAVPVAGTAEKATVCELPSPGPGPNCSNPDDCKTFTR